MGTLMNGLVDVYRTITAAAAKRNEVQLVLSIGDQLDPEQIGPLANNTIVVKRAPQLELLNRASVYHPCGFEHRAGVFGSRRSSGCYPGDR
jgi:UDP:flavonoid glycosyltransferase YjiC (YdhE family)